MCDQSVEKINPLMGHCYQISLYPKCLRISVKRKQKEQNSQRIGKSAVKYCLLKMAPPLNSICSN